MCLSKGSLASSVDCVIGNRGMTLDTVWCLLRILKDGFFWGGGAIPHSLQTLSSLPRDHTRAPCSGSTES